MNKISVLGVNFDNVNMAEAVDRCKTFLKGEKGNLIVTPNPEIVMRAKDNPEFKEINIKVIDEEVENETRSVCGNCR